MKALLTEKEKFKKMYMSDHLKILENQKIYDKLKNFLPVQNMELKEISEVKCDPILATPDFNIYKKD
jgi:hypothetical protein